MIVAVQLNYLTEFQLGQLLDFGAITLDQYIKEMENRRGEVDHADEVIVPREDLKFLGQGMHTKREEGHA